MNLEWIEKVIEYVGNNPYETTLGVAGVTALGIGTYRYIERKLHVAKTLDDFVERAKRSEAPVDIQFQYGRGLESYDESIILRAGKIRYESIGKCETFDTGHARGKAVGVLSLIETTIGLAEKIEKQGLEVTIKGKNIQYAKDYLVTCQDWVRKGYAFIAG